MFERAIKGRILSFLNKEGHLLSSQYSFCKDHSTDIAVLDMVEKSDVLGRKGSRAWFFLLILRRFLTLWTMAFFWLS